MEELNRTGTEILPYPLQRALVRNLSMAAEAAGRSDLLPLWAGQSANLSACTDVSAFLNSLVEEVSAIAGPVVEWSANRRKTSHERRATVYRQFEIEFLDPGVEVLAFTFG